MDMFVNHVQMPRATRCSRQKRRQQREHQPQTGQSWMASMLLISNPFQQVFHFQHTNACGVEADVIDVDKANAHSGGEAAECLLG